MIRAAEYKDNAQQCRELALYTGRDMNESTSIATIAGRIIIGTPFGTKTLRKRRPFFQNP
jgi:hypothetical protein